MKEDATANQRDGRWSWWLKVALLLTVAYAVGLWALLEPHEDAVWDRLAELPLNNLGDFLAGLFAPIAFLWLACAVGIQSQELAAQRRELRLTRVEFELAREVAEAQVDEARRQAEFIGAQTKLLQQQIQDRKWELADAELHRRLQGLRDAIGAYSDSIDARFDRGGARRHPEILDLSGMSTDPEIALSELTRRLLQYGGPAVDAETRSARARTVDPAFLNDVVARLNSLVRIEQELSPGRKGLLESARVVDARAAVTNLALLRA